MVESIRKLRKICYEGKKSPLPWYNKYFCTKISIYITKLLLHTNVTGNHVTLAMIIVNILGSIFLFNGLFTIGLILLHFAVILDDVDGEIARYRKSPTMLGVYIDTVNHAVSNPLMLFGFAYGIYRLHPNNLLIIFGFLSAVFSKSIVVPSIFDALASIKIRGEFAKKPSLKTNGKEVIEYEGQVKEYKNPFLRLYYLFREIWSHPTNLIMLTVLYIWEIVNLNYSFIPKFSASVIFFIIYGSFVTLNQLISFIFHTKKRSIDSFYTFLFNKK